MSPIHRVVRTIKLNETERIDVVRQDGEREVILAIVEEHGCVQDRKTVRLTLSKANKLARDLAGIAAQVGTEDDDLD